MSISMVSSSSQYYQRLYAMQTSGLNKSTAVSTKDENSSGQDMETKMMERMLRRQPSEQTDIKTIMEKMKAEGPMKMPEGFDPSQAPKKPEDMSQEEIDNMMSEMKDKTGSKPMPPPGGMRPMAPPSGINLTQLLSDSSDEDTDTSIDGISQKLVDILISSYDSSTESSEEYVSSLEETLSTNINNQKDYLDALYQNVMNKLNSWSSSDEEETAQSI